MRRTIIGGWSAVFAGWVYGIYCDRAVAREAVSNRWQCRSYGITAGTVLAAALVERSREPRTLPKVLSFPLTAAFVAGIGGYYWARATLRGNWSSEARIAENHFLVTHGPYAFVRHPIYSSKVLMALSSGLLLRSRRILALSGALLLAAFYQGKIEDSMLRRHFPESYDSYATRTGMLVPRLRCSRKTASRL